MAIEFVGSASGSAVGSTTVGATQDLTFLSGGIGAVAITGDLVISIVSTGSTADMAIGTDTVGYIELTQLFSDDNYDTNLSVAYKFMGATPDTTVVSTPSGSAADALCMVAYVFRGVNLTTPFDVTITTATGNNIAIPTPPAITPVTSGSVIIAIGAGAASSGAVFTTSDLDNFISLTRVDTNDSILGVGSIDWTSGTYTPSQFGGGVGGTDNSWAAATIALRPLASGPANLKSYNTNLKANIKTINTNPIVNVKSLDTNV